MAVSEPHAGSDVSAVHTHARRQGSDLIINGSKMWITNGGQADWACVLVNTSNTSNVHKNKSLVCVPLDAVGVHRSTPLDKLGMRSSDTVQLFFEDVRVSFETQKTIISFSTMIISKYQQKSSPRVLNISFSLIICA